MGHEDQVYRHPGASHLTVQQHHSLLREQTLCHRHQRKVLCAPVYLAPKPPSGHGLIRPSDDDAKIVADLDQDARP